MCTYTHACSHARRHTPEYILEVMTKLLPVACLNSYVLIHSDVICVLGRAVLAVLCQQQLVPVPAVASTLV